MKTVIGIGLIILGIVSLANYPNLGISLDISVMLTPHFGDIDPPHRNGSKNR